MDIATIIGLVGGSALVLSAVIIGGSALIFINIPGVLIVAGGTLATCFIKFSMGDGEYRPQESNVTTEGRRKNRRVEIILTPRSLKK